MKLRKTYSNRPINLSIPEFMEGKKFPVFKLILICVILIGLVVGGLYWYWASKWIITHGRITFEQTRIATPIKGRIASLNVKEGEAVMKGQLLATFDNSEYTAESKIAESKLAELNKQLDNLVRKGFDLSYQLLIESAQRDLELAKDKKREAEAELLSAKTIEEHAKKTMDRKNSLFSQKAITRQELDDSVAEWNKAKSLTVIAQTRIDEKTTSLKWAEKLLESQNKLLSFAKQKHDDDIALLKIQIESASAELNMANAKLQFTKIHSPTDGFIAWIARNVGEVVDHNNVIMMIYKKDSTWVEAYVSGSELTHIYDGKEAKFKVAGIKDKDFTGIIKLSYPQERSNPEIMIGPKDASFPSQIYRIVHPIKITWTEPVPATIQPEQIVEILIGKN